MPMDFATLRDALPKVLRAWRRADCTLEAWDSSIYLTERLHSYPRLTTIELRREHVRAMIEAGLRELKQRDPGAERLLHVRYLSHDRMRRREIAREKKGLPGRSSLGRVKYTQQQALDGLAHILMRLEEEARHERVARASARLDLELPPERFGQAAQEAQALEALGDPHGRWVVALEGLGGIGKTTLANAIMRALMLQPDFADIFWISARQMWFSFVDGLREDPRRPAALTYPQLLVELAEALDLDTAPAPKRVAELVRARLKANPYLVVIDNLETVQDYQAFVPELLRLGGPSKFLLTSRESLQGVPGVYAISMPELSEADLIALVRHTALGLALPEIAQAPDEALRAIYEAVGGNPLAAKLIVGQASRAELGALIDTLREARGRSVDELYRFIYWHSWHQLDPETRAVFLAMPAFAAGGAGLDLLAEATGFSEASTREAIANLVRRSLVMAGGTPAARRYRIHRLTEWFLRYEVLKWPLDSEAVR